MMPPRKAERRRPEDNRSGPRARQFALPGWVDSGKTTEGRPGPDILDNTPRRLLRQLRSRRRPTFRTQTPIFCLRDAARQRFGRRDPSGIARSRTQTVRTRHTTRAHPGGSTAEMRLSAAMRSTVPPEDWMASPRHHKQPRGEGSPAMPLPRAAIAGPGVTSVAYACAIKPFYQLVLSAGSGRSVVVVVDVLVVLLPAPVLP